MDNNAYQINNLISAYRNRNKLAAIDRPNDTGPIIKQYTNKFVDSIMREKVPIHVQAFKEVSVLDNNMSIDSTANDLNFKRSNPFGSSKLKNNLQSTGTKIHGEGDKAQFRIRP
jgi:hypothetical protein